MIFFLMMTDSFHAGRATYSDKLFKFRNGRFEDLLSDELNVRRGVANRMAGRSVACVDRKVSKPMYNVPQSDSSHITLPISSFYSQLIPLLSLCREQAVTQSTWPTMPVATLVPTLS